MPKNREPASDRSSADVIELSDFRRRDRLRTGQKSLNERRTKVQSRESVEDMLDPILVPGGQGLECIRVSDLTRIIDKLGQAWRDGSARQLAEQASRVSWADEIKSVPLPSASIENYRAFCAEQQGKP